MRQEKPDEWYGFVAGPSKEWLDRMGADVEGYCPFCVPTVQLAGIFEGGEEDALAHFQELAQGNANVWAGYAG